MKKIVWIFGQSATGKKTLINKLLDNDQKTLEELKLGNIKIIACNNTIEDNKLVVPSIVDPYQYDDTNMQDNNEYFDRKKAINRRSCIMTDCLNFINSDNELLLIKGQDNDYWPGRGDIIKYFLEKFANHVQIELFILTVQDSELWEKRVKNKDWFNKFEDKTSVMKHMIEDRLTQKHENSVIAAFEGYNIPVIFIDSGENQYSIVSEIKIKERK